MPANPDTADQAADARSGPRRVNGVLGRAPQSNLQRIDAGHRPGVRAVVVPLSHPMRALARLSPRGPPPPRSPGLRAGPEPRPPLVRDGAVPTGRTRDFIDRFSSRGAHLDASLELSPAFHLELSAGLEPLQRRQARACSTTSDGRDVSGKQFRYLNAIPADGRVRLPHPAGERQPLLGRGATAAAALLRPGGRRGAGRVLGLRAGSGASSRTWASPSGSGTTPGPPSSSTAGGTTSGTGTGFPVQQYWSFGVGLLFGGSGKK